MKYTIAVIVVATIKKTLNVAGLSPLSIAENSGLRSPIKIIKVKITTICEINLFSFFTPLFIKTIKAPKKTGIRAVIGLSF